MTTNENAPDGVQPAGATTEPSTSADQKETTMAIIAETGTPRYVVTGTSVYDRTAGRIAKFENVGVAQLGADWLNGPDATPEDYVWSRPDSRCSHAWCNQDHVLSHDPHLHVKPYERAGVRIDFVLDEAPDAERRVYLNWTDMFEVELGPDDLGELNAIAAALIIAKAAFEQFVESVSA